MGKKLAKSQSQAQGNHGSIKLLAFTQPKHIVVLCIRNTCGKQLNFMSPNISDSLVKCFLIYQAHWLQNRTAERSRSQKWSLHIPWPLLLFSHPHRGSSGQQISDCNQSQANSLPSSMPEITIMRPVEDTTEKNDVLPPVLPVVL